MLSMKSKINFTQLGRYGDYGEQRYRIQFGESFDFLDLNTRLSKDYLSDDRFIAFDPSYVNKSGKSTPGASYFWSGCANASKWGLEFGGLAAVDCINKTSLHLTAQQTIKDSEKKLNELYVDMIIDNKEKLKQISSLVILDGWFYQKYVVDSLSDEGFEVITRAKKNSTFRYLYDGPKTGKPGRPKVYDGKVDLNCLDHFNNIINDDEHSVDECVVYANALKRKVRLVIVKSKEKKSKQVCFISTDLNMDGLSIYKKYRLRFQIEFLYRDGKQHVGMNDCQARSENRLNFHVNAALTAINVAKCIHWFKHKSDDRGAFSMATIKTQNNNKLLLGEFISRFRINPNLKINKRIISQLEQYGSNAA